MRNSPVLLTVTAVAVLSHAESVAIDRYSTELVEVNVEVLTDGLNHPWGVEVLPDGSFILTERSGQMRIFKNGRLSEPVSGVPEVVARGQGGLLDVALAKDFAASGVIYFTYSEPGTGGSGTALAKAVLVREGENARLEGTSVIYSMNRKTGGGRHFGSRIELAIDGSIFLTTGDRGEPERAQDMSDTAGAVLRIDSEGGIPKDNPFVGDEKVSPEIWSKGHRNAQGMDLDAKTNTLFTVEHGAAGGDEINQPAPGRNYGWPVISYGRHYSGGKIGIGTEAEGYEQPLHYWDPSIAPGGMIVYRGSMFPEWDGDFLVTALKDRMLVRVDRDNTGNITGEERLFENKYGRMREVVSAPDGSILILTDEPNGRILRVTRQ